MQCVDSKRQSHFRALFTQRTRDLGIFFICRVFNHLRLVSPNIRFAIFRRYEKFALRSKRDGRRKPTNETGKLCERQCDPSNLVR